MNELSTTLKAMVKGEVLAEREPYATDFGRVLRRAPLLVLRPEGEDDVLAAFRFAREAKLKVAIRGAGHSVMGQTLSEGGLVLALEVEDAELQWLDGERVEVSARTRWDALERAVNAKGRTMPVLTDYVGLSVGGTLSVGGYGIRSLHHGTQGDNVERLRLVLPDGRALWCSETEQRELFTASLAGLGQLGLIERVVMRTLPHRKWTRNYRYAHPSAEALAESALWLVESDGRPDAFYGYGAGPKTPMPGVFATKYGFEHARRDAPEVSLPRELRGIEPTEIEDVEDLAFSLHDNRKLWVDWLAGHRRVWVDFLLDAEGFVPFCRALDGWMKEPEFLANLGTLYFLAVDKKRAPRPLLEAASPSAGKLGFLVGLFYMVPDGDAAALAGARAALRRALERCAELGGRPYLYGWNDLDPELSARIYGADRDALERLRGLVDPDGVLGRFV